MIIRDADARLLQPLSRLFESDAPGSVIRLAGLSRCFLPQEDVVEVDNSSSVEVDSWVTAPDCFSQSASRANALWISATASSATSKASPGCAMPSHRLRHRDLAKKCPASAGANPSWGGALSGRNKRLCLDPATGQARDHYLSPDLRTLRFIRVHPDIDPPAEDFSLSRRQGDCREDDTGSLSSLSLLQRVRSNLLAQRPRRYLQRCDRAYQRQFSLGSPEGCDRVYSERPNKLDRTSKQFSNLRCSGGCGTESLLDEE